MEATKTKDNITTIPYWNMIKHLNERDKLELLVLLSQSLKEGSKKVPVSAKDLYGVWSDDGYTAEEFMKEIKEARSFKRDIPVL